MSILRADSIRDRAGTGAPDFPNGLTGNITGTATVATNAQGITGTPNITVGTVTGTDATFSGNLTVNGTTTTIDTAVTSVDSLAVDGNVTALGTLGIGTVTPGRHLTVSGGAAEGAIQITNNTSGHTAANGFELIHFTNGETQLLNRENGAMRFDTNGTERLRIDSSGNLIIGSTSAATNSQITLRSASPHLSLYGTPGSNTSQLNLGDTDDHDIGNISYDHSDNSMRFTANASERLRITSGGIAIFKAGLAEKVNVKTQFAGANSTSINDGNVILTTTAEPGNTYPNITGVHTVLSSGEGFSITIALKVNGSGTINNFYIDGVPQNIEWSGGSAPSAGSSGYDVFTFSAMKTGTGTSDYTVFGAATNYA